MSTLPCCRRGHSSASAKLRERRRPQSPTVQRDLATAPSVLRPQPLKNAQLLSQPIFARLVSAASGGSASPVCRCQCSPDRQSHRARRWRRYQGRSKESRGRGRRKVPELPPCRQTTATRGGHQRQCENSQFAGEPFRGGQKCVVVASR